MNSAEISNFIDVLMRLATFTRVAEIRQAADLIRKQQATIEAQDALLKAYLEVKA